MRPLLLTGLLIALSSVWPDASAAQSVNCTTPRTRDEVAICRDAQLARLDQELATLQLLELGKLSRDDREAYEQNATLFLNARRRCGESSRCIEQSYRNRIKELQDLSAAGHAGDPGSASRRGAERSARRSGRTSDEVPPAEASGSSAPVALPSGAVIRTEPAPLPLSKQQDQRETSIAPAAGVASEPRLLPVPSRAPADEASTRVEAVSPAKPKREGKATETPSAISVEARPAPAADRGTADPAASRKRERTETAETRPAPALDPEPSVEAAGRAEPVSSPKSKRQSNREATSPAATTAAAPPEAKPAPQPDRDRSREVAAQREPSPSSPSNAETDPGVKREAKREPRKSAEKSQAEARTVPASTTAGSGGSAPTIQWVNPPPSAGR